MEVERTATTVKRYISFANCFSLVNLGSLVLLFNNLPHYIENTGTEDLRYLEAFRTARFEDLSVSEWLSHTPAELVMAHLNIDRESYDQIPKEKVVLVGR